MSNTDISFSTSLSDGDIRLKIMSDQDFDALFNVAKDPLIWDQHNEPQRSTQEGFSKYFNSGINNTENCYLIFYKEQLIGSTRYYKYRKDKSSIRIGYTFYAREFWGTLLNKKVKKIMLDYAFNYVNTIFFDVWGKNFRSQKSVIRLGAKLCKEECFDDMLVYMLKAEDWKKVRKNYIS